MLQAEKYIEKDALASWIQSWDEHRYMDYFDTQIEDRLKRLKVRSSMEENIVKIKKLCADMGENIQFHPFLQLMNRIVFNCYFKIGNSALRIANYYEEILVPADQTTRRRLFGYRDGRRQTGQIKVFIQGQEIGQLGEQSDMFHLIFDACFHTEDELFDEDDDLFDDSAQAPSYGEDTLLTLKIWEPQQVLPHLDSFVDSFLFHCSTKLGLNFKRASFETPLDRRNEPIDEEIHVKPLRSESLPLLYFNSAAHNLPPQIVFMSYYQSISYFFERAVHLIIREKMQSMFSQEDTEQPSELRRISKAINTLRERFSEKESLELVFKRTLKLEHLVHWLEAAPERKAWFCQFHDAYKELPLVKVTSEKEALRSLVERVYALKSTIEEARDTRDNFIWIASLDEQLLRRDLPLLKLLAARTIEVWSLPDQETSR